MAYRRVMLLENDGPHLRMAGCQWDPAQDGRGDIRGGKSGLAGVTFMQARVPKNAMKKRRKPTSSSINLRGPGTHASLRATLRGGAAAEPEPRHSWANINSEYAGCTTQHGNGDGRRSTINECDGQMRDGGAVAVGVVGST